MSELSKAVLHRFSTKYIWWKTPEQAAAHPDYILTQVMNIGEYQDVQWLVHHIDKTMLCKILKEAEVGRFTERSWHYWHYRLQLASDENQIPPLPTRKLA
jgi:hypothetical protein